MAYVAHDWSEQEGITSEKVSWLNNLETIYDEAISYMNNKTHDVYLKTESDSRYYRRPAHPSGRSDTGHGSGIDVTTVDGMTLAELLAEALPVGSIGMFKSGTLPDGYAECNGANGTPNLQNVIPRGAGNTYSPGDYGGGSPVTPTFDNFDTNEHLLTDNEIPRHQHTYTDTTNNLISVYQGYSGLGHQGTNSRTTTNINPGNVTARVAHVHADSLCTYVGYLDENGTHHGTSSLDVMPASRAVRFIMRI